ncbi:PREDICTED: adenosine kinase 1-like [Nicrophorus vespilloides]|uniref:Adenosine kinase n=1 Tax=Nicrophorus vespilloides TaxID=110193 RepID=A0ABM1NE10_NICVS|nr:PREDICTED: adenosine kinase 1-like [Nicrophorus vespilloides]XP_017785060.1 PREDICTED: adenosine kinase 1-like [Nicrophorus vespilloides]
MLTCIGSPLLDIVVHVDREFLIRHGLEPDAAHAADGETLFNELQDLNAAYVCGGSVTNSVRVLKWLQPEARVVYIGAIGADTEGDFLIKKLTSVECDFQVDEIRRTGRCAVLVDGPTRTLYTDLGASTSLNLSHLQRPETLKKLNLTKFVYFSAFLLRASKEYVDFLLDSGKQILFNLGAAFLCDLYPIEMTRIIKKSKVIFGNELELRAVGKMIKLYADDCKELGGQVYKSLCEIDQILVITRGERSALVFAKQQMKEFAVEQVNNVVDTNGAGDAFVGGFLSNFIVNSPLEECMRLFAAGEIVQNVGCTFSNIS